MAEFVLRICDLNSVVDFLVMEMVMDKKCSLTGFYCQDDKWLDYKCYIVSWHDFNFCWLSFSLANKLERNGYGSSNLAVYE